MPPPHLIPLTGSCGINKRPPVVWSHGCGSDWLWQRQIAHGTVKRDRAASSPHAATARSNWTCRVLQNAGALAALTSAAAVGEITPAEAFELGQVIETPIRAQNASDAERREKTF
jgi:hypothetical protein